MNGTLYVVGWNMPGYLPESEPYAYQTWDEAKQALIDELERQADMTEPDDEEGQRLADESAGEAEDLNLSNGPEWSTVIGNMAFWINATPAHDLNPNILQDENGSVTKFAWPGGYRVWYVTHDGGELCAECVSENLAQCCDHDDSGWFVEGYFSEADSDECGPCDHCGRNSDIVDDDETTLTPDESELHYTSPGAQALQAYAKAHPENVITPDDGEA